MADIQEKINKYIIPNITESVISLFNYNWSGPHSFYTWLTYSSDADFAYIYEMEFKRHFLPFFTPETERILSYYSQNFAHSIWSFFEIEKEHSKNLIFIRKMIDSQLKNLDFDQLFMEN
jgi:hypothetical protein